MPRRRTGQWQDAARSEQWGRDEIATRRKAAMTPDKVSSVSERLERFAGYLEQGWTVYAGGANAMQLDPADLRIAIDALRSYATKEWLRERMLAQMGQEAGDVPPHISRSFAPRTSEEK